MCSGGNFKGKLIHLEAIIKLLMAAIPRIQNQFIKYNIKVQTGDRCYSLNALM